MPSRVIDFIAFEESRSELTLTFTTGKIYIYGLVPKRIYDDFRAAHSKGIFFNAYIRDRYPTRQIRLPGKLSDPAQNWTAALDSLKKRYPMK
jgi:hypothetical protein